MWANASKLTGENIIKQQDNDPQANTKQGQV